MEDKQNRIATEDRLFLLCYGVWFFFCCLYFTRFRPALPISKFYTSLCWLALPVMIVKLVVRRRSFSVSACVLAALFLATSVIVAYVTGSDKMPAYCMWIIAASYTDKKRILKVSFWVILVCVILTVGAAYLDLIPNNIQVTPTRLRRELGFRYPSYCSHYILILSMLFVSFRGKIRLPELLVMLAANYVVYLATDTRADLAIAVVVLITLFVVLHFNIGPFLDQFAVLIAALPFLMAAGSFLLHYFYDEENRLFLLLNKVLSGRLALGRFALNHYTYHPFGQKLSRFIDDKYSFVDNYYIRSFLKTGIFFLLFMLSGFAKALYRFCKKHETALVLALFAMLLHGLVDPELGDIRWDPFVLLVSSLFESPQQLDG